MNSFFMASFALFEHQLIRLCGRVRRRQGSPFSVNQFKYSLTERAKLYLTKLGVPFPIGTPEWSEIIR